LPSINMQAFGNAPALTVGNATLCVPHNLAEPMWHHAFYIVDSAGCRIALAMVSRDLSERRQTEERIAAGR